MGRAAKLTYRIPGVADVPRTGLSHLRCTRCSGPLPVGLGRTNAAFGTFIDFIISEWKFRTDCPAARKRSHSFACVALSSPVQADPVPRRGIESALLLKAVN